MPNTIPKSVSLMQIFTDEVKDYYQQHQDLITEDLIDNLRKAGNYGKQIALDILDMDTDDEGYYLDAFGNQVHYRGNRYLKAPYTKFKLADIHVSELKKCTEDIEYFKDNYIKIKTKSGFDFPEIRDYQNEFLSVINNPKNESIVALMSRQCISENTIVKSNIGDIAISKLFDLIDCNSQDQTDFTNCNTQDTNSDLQTQDLVDYINNDSEYVESRTCNNVKVLTPIGFVKVLKIHKTIPLSEVKLVLEGNKTLYCSENHVLIPESDNSQFDFSNGIYAKDSLNCILKTIYGPKKVIRVIHTGKIKPMYDLTLEHTHIYYTNGVFSHNSGKSVTIGIYLTWLFTFKKDMNIGICANRWSLGKELLNNISNMYLSLPIWMKQGIRSWNTGTSINNENNMRIIIDTPSANSFRGYSCNVLIVDECIAGDSIISLIDSDKQIYIDTIARFYQYFQDKDVSSYKIFTSNGWKHFDGFSKTTRSNGLRLVLQDNICLECTPEHKLYDHGKFKYASDFVVGDEVQFNCTLRKRINKIVPINIKQEYYDAINVQGGHHFTANGVEVSNCAFIPPYRWEEFADSFFPSQSALAWKKNIIISTANGLNHFYKIVQGAKLNKVVEDLSGNEQVQLEDGTITTLEEVYQSGKFTDFANLVSGAA